MHNIQEELNEARTRIAELNAVFIKEQDRKFAQSEENIKRKVEDGESAQELLKSLNIDLSKITAYNDAEAKKAQKTLEQVKSKLKILPKDILSQAQDQMWIDEILAAGQDIDNPFVRRFFIYNAIAGIERIYVNVGPGASPGLAQGNCGDITYGSGLSSQTTPWCLTTGSGTGCIGQIAVVCSFWFLIPREYIPTQGTLRVTPYYDIHGFYWDRANMVFGTSKEAAVMLDMQTWLHPYAGPATYRIWTALNYDGHNIDQSGRIDYTGYNSSTTATLQVAADEPVLVQVIVDVEGLAQGAGSMGLLNFNGEGNAIKIPDLRCVLETQPVNYP